MDPATSKMPTSLVLKLHTTQKMPLWQLLRSFTPPKQLKCHRPSFSLTFQHISGDASPCQDHVIFPRQHPNLKLAIWQCTIPWGNSGQASFMPNIANLTQLYSFFPLQYLVFPVHKGYSSACLAWDWTTATYSSQVCLCVPFNHCSRSRSQLQDLFSTPLLCYLQSLPVAATADLKHTYLHTKPWTNSVPTLSSTAQQDQPSFKIQERLAWKLFSWSWINTSISITNPWLACFF